MQDTNIEWCDLAWNPTRGCSRISPGCQHCYAEQIAARFSDGPFSGFAEHRIIGGKREAHWTGRVELLEDKLLEPLKRRKWARKFREEHGRKPRCFVNSMSDLFHEKLPDESIDRVFAVMALCPEINFLCLTKRADGMERYFKGVDLYGRRLDAARQFRARFPDAGGVGVSNPVDCPPKWIWLGVSVEDQQRADERIPYLLRTPAAVRFLSVEPMLGPINLQPHLFCVECATRGDGPRGEPCTNPRIDWVIVGGESGAGARPFDIAWARSIRDQCKASGTKFFLKQVGAFPCEYREVGTSKGGSHVPLKIRDKKGGDMREWPEDLRIREFPR